MLRNLLFIFGVFHKLSSLVAAVEHSNAGFVKISSSGFSSEEDDILPYSLIKRIHKEQQHEQNAGRQPQWQRGKQSAYKTGPSTIVRARHFNVQRVSQVTPPPSPYQYYNIYHKQDPNPPKLGRPYVRLERARINGARQYNLYDDDGEYLMNFKIHHNHDVGGEDLIGHQSQRHPKMQLISQKTVGHKSEQHYWLQI